MNTKTFDFYLLDIMLPDGSGLDIANRIREKSDAPIFYLTAKLEAIKYTFILSFQMEDIHPSLDRNGYPGTGVG